MEALRSGFYPDSPSFGCHATLISGLNHKDHGSLQEIVSTTEKAIEIWSKQPRTTDESSSKWLSATFEDVTTRGSYFQCILLALNTHNERLMSLNQHMRQAFNLDDQPAFFPHISLLYADLTAEQARAQIRDMEHRGVFTRNTDSAESASRINFAGLTHLDFLEVQLYDCNGPPESWKSLHTFSLS